MSTKSGEATIGQGMAGNWRESRERFHNALKTVVGIEGCEFNHASKEWNMNVGNELGETELKRVKEGLHALKDHVLDPTQS